jgi:hypothetical protein
VGTSTVVSALCLQRLTLTVTSVNPPTLVTLLDHLIVTSHPLSTLVNCFCSTVCSVTLLNSQTSLSVILVITVTEVQQLQMTVNRIHQCEKHAEQCQHKYSVACQQIQQQKDSLKQNDLIIQQLQLQLEQMTFIQQPHSRPIMQQHHHHHQPLRPSS